MNRAAFASNPRAVHEWLRDGNVGTNHDIANATGIKWYSVRTALRRLLEDGFVEIVATVAVPGQRDPANVYGCAKDERWTWSDRARPLPGVAGAALNRRAPIERAWHGVAA